MRRMLRPEVNLNIIQIFSSYLTENTLQQHYTHQPVNAVYCENHTEHINTLCEQNAEFSSYLAGNTLRLPYKAQPVNVV
jgi:hypothetical protein